MKSLITSCLLFNLLWAWSTINQHFIIFLHYNMEINKLALYLGNIYRYGDEPGVWNTTPTHPRLV